MRDVYLISGNAIKIKNVSFEGEGLVFYICECLPYWIHL